MPWLPVIKLGSAGPYVKLLQMNMDGLALNYNGFLVNGYFDKKTKHALQNFQDRFDLVRDGVAGPITWRLLRDNVKAVQRLLNSRRYGSGSPDGWFGALTRHAAIVFQRDNGLYPSGIVDPRTRRRLFNPYPKDNYEYRPTSTSINSLHSRIVPMAKRFLQLTHANGLDVRIVSVFRSWNEQDRLFAQGRWESGSIVTNARGGESYHNWGLAFDADPFENGKVSNDVEKYKQMGQLGEQAGFEWGGTFKSITDYPHFQYTFGLGTWDLLNGVSPPA